MRVKELKKTVNVCWSPAELHPSMLAAGSAAQQVDSSFSSSSQLELYSLNLDDSSIDLKLKSSLNTQHKFQKLVWSGAGTLVGGCDGGLLEFYNVDKLLSGATDALVSSNTKHNGNVSALDINPFQKNLLASGASESEIYIWDLNNTSQPMAPGSPSQPLDHVQAVAWNQQVQHILGSTFATRCVVWDLRKNEPIMKLSDSVSRSRWRALAWHTRVPTQLCVACDDDQAPLVQLWDLRLAASPVVTLEGHQKGVMSLSWSPHDPDLLLSAGKDGRVLCWNPNNTKPGGELVMELSSQEQWVFDVAWSPRSPGLLYSASFDQQVAVHSLLGGRVTHQSGQNALSFAESFGGAASLSALPAVAPGAPPPRVAQPPRAPLWLRKPPKSSFGFGGKLVTFEKCPQEAGSPKVVYISQVVSQPELVQQAAELEAALEEAHTPDVLAEYCRVRGDAATEQDERYCWFFLRANFLPTFRTEVLNLLGFKQDEIPSKFKAPSDAAGLEPNDIAALSRGESTETEAELSTSTDLSDAQTLIERKLAGIDLGAPPSNVVIPTGEDSTSLICRALVSGNLEEAAELCVLADRLADAMLIASLGSQELLYKVQRYHLSRAGSEPVSLVAGSLLSSSWQRLVTATSAGSWREALATLLTHADDNSVARYCELLGDKLSKESDPSLSSAATICYLCSLSIPQLVRKWQDASLHDAAEKVLLARKAARGKGRGESIDGSESLLTRYAEQLCEAGALRGALCVLRDVPGGARERARAAENPQQPQHSSHRSGSVVTQKRGHLLSHNDASNTYGAVNSYESSWQQATVAPPSQYNNASQLSQPPRPASGGPQAGSISGRSKYKVDPSVQSAPLYNQYSFNNPVVSQPQSYGYNSPMPDQYNNSSVPNSFVPNQPNPALNPLNPSLNPLNPALNPLNPSLNPLNPALNPLNPTLNPMNPAANQPMNGNYYNPPVQEQAPPAQSKPVPPGWNDPPMMTSKPKAKPETQAAQAPITHPIFGVEQPQHVPLNPQYPGHQAPGPQYPGHQAPGPQYPGHQAPGPLYPGQQAPGSQYPTQNVAPAPGNYPDQYKQYNPGMAPAYPQKSASPGCVEPAALQKCPLPEQHRVLQTVLDAIRDQCATRANNPQMKRKLEDVHRRLETLYDMLREYRLSESALSTLHSCVQSASEADYNSALQAATSLASGADFAAAASFLPGLKVLMQCASQLQVYVQVS